MGTESQRVALSHTGQENSAWLASSGPVHGASDKFRGFLFTHPEHSFLHSHLCISGVAWKEPKQSFICWERPCRFQNILLVCYPAPWKTSGREVGGQGRSESSLQSQPLFSLGCHAMFSVGLLCGGQGGRSCSKTHPRNREALGYPNHR